MFDEPAASHFAIEIDRTPEIIIVRCTGKLVAGSNELLFAEVRPLIPGAKRIVLDLTDLTSMDSMGLGTLIRLYVSARSAGCDLELINIGRRIREMLSVTNLLSFFAIVGENNIRLP